MFDERKERGDSELGLVRQIPSHGVFPGKDIQTSGTRKDNNLVSKDVLNKMYMLRRVLSPMGTVDAVEFLIDKLKDTKSNDDFFTRMNQ